MAEDGEEAESGILGQLEVASSADGLATGQNTPPPPVEAKEGIEKAPPALLVGKKVGRLTPFLKQMEIAIRRHKSLHCGKAASKDCETCRLTSVKDPQILAEQARSDRCLQFLDSHNQSAEAYCAKYWRGKYTKRPGPHKPANSPSGGCCELWIPRSEVRLSK